MYWVFKSLLRRQQKLQNRQLMVMVVLGLSRLKFSFFYRLLCIFRYEKMLFLQFKNNMLWLFSLLKVHHMFSNQCFPLQISWKKKGKSDREVKKIKKGFMTKKSVPQTLLYATNEILYFNDYYHMVACGCLPVESGFLRWFQRVLD